MDTSNNPFAVKTPESLTPTELVELFVPYPVFSHLQENGHQFLHGHRGSGKSMMLRMMEPECQAIHRGCSVTSIPYFACYLSIKATEINQPEFERLENEPSGAVLSEHVLVTKVLGRLVGTVEKYSNLLDASALTDYLVRLRLFTKDTFTRRLELCGWENIKVGVDAAQSTIAETFDSLARIVDDVQATTNRYIRQRAFTADPVPYTGALLGFQDVVLPIVRSLRDSKLIPDCPFYLLIDDADNLTLQQTKALNTWVSYRTTDTLSLKVSTQLGYKTWLTSGGAHIEAPHDFSEILFTSVKTGSVQHGYLGLVQDIVNKRLRKYGLANVSASDYFPEDSKQTADIRAIGEELKAKWSQKAGGGYRPGDDAYRYARPEYIRRLSGSSKQGSKYKYAGFEQLVHISSGTIRFFLDPAAKMFSEELRRSNGVNPASISPAVQDEIIREQSDELSLTAFDRLKDQVSNPAAQIDQLREIDCLKNLVQAVGSLFQAYLMDEHASQRRFFSFQISTQPNERLRSVLNLGVRYGYFYRDSIGRKDGMGRNTLYVLTRRLAPAFKLDPSGFSGYLSITNEDLCSFMQNPNTWRQRYQPSALVDSRQLSLVPPEESSL
jgi:hypothetical protein